jgi:site-specific recombinase
VPSGGRAALTVASALGWSPHGPIAAADPRVGRAARHLWLIELLAGLRAAPEPAQRVAALLDALDADPAAKTRVGTLLRAALVEVDSAALLSDHGFAARTPLLSEFLARLRARVLPRTPDTEDLGELFDLLFCGADDAAWVERLDDGLLARIGALVAPVPGWRAPFLDGITYLASAVRAAGFATVLRRRMDAALLADRPFHQLARAAEQMRAAVESGDAAAMLPAAQYLRALLDTCRRAALSVHDHLETHGVSVDVVFEVDQLVRRTQRIELLLGAVIDPDPRQELRHVLAELVRSGRARRSLRGLFADQYSLLARKVAERSAETGEHYITRNVAEYRAMLGAALGGGAIIAGTTFAKFWITGLGLAQFWSGFWAGTNYAASFVIVMLLHWTVATKQPAMTAPAMAARLGDMRSDDAIERFVDEVAHLIRSQAAGIFGNLIAVTPLVLGVQWLVTLARGTPLVDARDAEYVLHSITLLGPTLLFAAFTGVLLFASSLVAGWAENWFVWHRIDSAIAWNPRLRALLGAERAQRWAAWWRANVSGLAGNVSLGLMLGLIPALALFFGLPIEVRHVTLSTGQLAAAAGTLGIDLLQRAEFWWCVVGIVGTGVLNLAVSFFCAFKVALRSRGVRVAERSRIRHAIIRRLLRHPGSFLVPPREGDPR